MGVAQRRVRGVLSGPEQLFEVTRIEQDADGLAASMQLGPAAWVGGRPQLAALGVLVDDVLGYAVNTLAEGWSVSTEVSLDALAPLPTSGVLTCRARVIHADTLGAFTAGEVTTEDGTLVARAVLRGRFRDLAPDPAVLAAGRTTTLPPVDRTDLDTLLGPDVVHDHLGLSVRTSERFANPLGNLHGGVHVCLHERAATMAAPGLPVTASIRVQLLRGVPGGAQVRLVPRVLHNGRSLSVVAVEARDTDGRLCSTSTVVRHLEV